MQDRKAEQTLRDRAVDLKRLTTFRIGGRPACYARPRSYAELAAALSICRQRGLRVRILGGGSNLLVDENDLSFAVIHVRAPAFDWIARVGPAKVRVGAGVPLRRLLAYCRRQGLSGLEFLAGVPGTVGGALAGNAGAWGESIAGRSARAWVLDDECGRTEVAAAEVEFGYRRCSLGRRIICEVEFELDHCEPALLGRRMEGFVARRSAIHPMRSASAGCIFKNPPGASAGKLLDLCGMKGVRVGGAEVSRLHANFICNVGGATAQDVLTLIGIMREAAKRAYSVELELEVKRWPSKPEAA